MITPIVAAVMSYHSITVSTPDPRAAATPARPGVARAAAPAPAPISRVRRLGRGYGRAEGMRAPEVRRGRAAPA
ncbi:hypothetical protein B0E53_02216 [Micromonospora sp. MH33]|nr:hypothetical protein B0E53_02216 [Micromonospora sp. MH33]